MQRISPAGRAVVKPARPARRVHRAGTRRPLAANRPAGASQPQQSDRR